VGLAGYKGHLDHIRQEHISLTTQTFFENGLEVWNPSGGQQARGLDTDSAVHYFRLINRENIDASLVFLSELGYQDIEHHNLKVGIHIVIGYVSDTVRSNLAHGIYRLN
jgi:hypothetical protein